MSGEFGYHEKKHIEDRELSMFVESAVGFAMAAGKSIRPFFRNGAAVDNKLQGVGFDPVTEADRAAESVIRGRIEDRYPAHGIFGEELGVKSGNGLTWVIDPIDGTRSFMSGMLHWGVLIALFDGETPQLGVMYQPFTDEMFVGINSSAQYRRGAERKALRVRPCVDLQAAVLATTGPDFLTEGYEQDAFVRVRSNVRMTRYGGDCYLYCMLAMGQLDLAVEAGLKPYDIQALIPIVRGAGGVVTTWDGRDAAMGGRILAAGDARVHRAALELLGRET